MPKLQALLLLIRTTVFFFSVLFVFTIFFTQVESRLSRARRFSSFFCCALSPTSNTDCLPTTRPLSQPHHLDPCPPRPSPPPSPSPSPPPSPSPSLSCDFIVAEKRRPYRLLEAPRDHVRPPFSPLGDAEAGPVHRLRVLQEGERGPRRARARGCRLERAIVR